MPSADFCPAVSRPLGRLSRPETTRDRSPGVSSIAFSAQPPDLRFAPLMDMAVAVRRPLVRRLRVVSGSGSSARTFASRFLQTPPRGDSPCASLTLHLHLVALVQIAVTSKNAPGLRHGDFKPQARRSKPQAQLGLERPNLPVRTVPSGCGAVAR